MTWFFYRVPGIIVFYGLLMDMCGVKHKENLKIE